MQALIADISDAYDCVVSILKHSQHAEFDTAAAAGVA
jgi:hypothetical protein